MGMRQQCGVAHTHLVIDGREHVRMPNQVDVECRNHHLSRELLHHCEELEVSVRRALEPSIRHHPWPQGENAASEFVLRSDGICQKRGFVEFVASPWRDFC